jgi:hypothetical protein
MVNIAIRFSDKDRRFAEYEIFTRSVRLAVPFLPISLLIDKSIYLLSLLHGDSAG